MLTPPYKFKHTPSRPLGQRVNRVKPEKTVERFDGNIKGATASDLEERFANALDRAGVEYQYQVPVRTQVSIPGEEKSVDFLVFTGIIYPVEIDGEIGHKTSEQIGYDEIREVLLNEAFRKLGYAPLIRIPWYELETPEDADLVVRRYFT